MAVVLLLATPAGSARPDAGAHGPRVAGGLPLRAEPGGQRRHLARLAAVMVVVLVLVARRRVLFE